MNYSIRNLSLGDLSLGLRLSQSAGWNQTVDDWARFIQHEPAGCFAAFQRDQLIGTVTTTCYGSKLAWVGMMLVHTDYQKQGVGTKLLKTALRYLEKKSIACVKLDATPLGHSLYSKLGFVDEYTLRRWYLKRQPTVSDQSSELQPVSLQSAQEIDCIQPLDESAFGCDRTQFLGSLRAGSHFESMHGGFGMRRTGRVSDYLGPVVAEEAPIGRTLVRRLVSQSETDLFWDVLDENLDAVELADHLGFQPIRNLTRMHLGRSLTIQDPQKIYALADPAVG
ncbi:GNAT family N-acetyltransferase [bacterium]|nr:GNAT family N-acetyltransferase [Rubripirellula sp.]MDB4338892.1 GNAT family N-acetyltransferase [Rubripirellula sp.]MDC0278766.1 GNAT family N-acetyltransferase [bacterium]MDC0295410.1 GNAT family N-acetyltransferase [bacterium]